jgi:hypothetical protein
MTQFEKYTRLLEITNGDPWRIASMRVSKQKYAAKKRNLEWTLSDNTIINKIAKSTHCALSGRRLVFEINSIDTPSIDRKKNHLGYTPRNVQVVTSAVNKAKNVLSDQEFIQMCCDVAQQNGWIGPNEPIVKD